MFISNKFPYFVTQSKTINIMIIAKVSYTVEQVVNAGFKYTEKTTTELHWNAKEAIAIDLDVLITDLHLFHLGAGVWGIFTKGVTTPYKCLPILTN